MNVMNNKRVAMLLLAAILCTGSASAQKIGEYPMYFSGKAEHGVFIASNFNGSNVVLYVPETNVKEAFAGGKHNLLIDGMFITVSSTHVRNFLPEGKKRLTDKEIVKRHHAWEMDHQKKAAENVVVLPAKAARWGVHDCLISRFRYPSDKVESQVLVTLVANQTVVVFSVPLFTQVVEQYRPVTYEQAVAAIEKIVRTMLIYKDPVPFGMMRILIMRERAFMEKTK